MTQRCRWAGTGNPRLVPGRHGEECPGDECSGCLPCPSRHCVVCAKAHVEEQTCAGCIAATRDDLEAIASLCHHLRNQAYDGGREGKLEAARPIPGGDAMVLLSPGSDGRARAWAKERGDDVSHQLDESYADPVPPLAMLATWEDDWRDVIGHDAATGTATLTKTISYLDLNLAYVAQRHDAFDEFARDLRRMRARLEGVLYAGEREEMSQTPCIDCGRLLIKEFGDRAADDRWRCPRCRRRYSHGEFVRAQAQHLASEGADRFVKLQDALKATPRPEHTVRTWLKRCQVRSYCDITTHAVMVWWPDIRRLDREAEVRRSRRKSAA